METIEEMTLIINGKKNTYKLYEYQEETVRKIKTPTETGDITPHMGDKYIDAKVKIRKYALHQELENDDNQIVERLICETEIYATILSVYKDILEELIKLIDKCQAL